VSAVVFGSPEANDLLEGTSLKHLEPCPFCGEAKLVSVVVGVHEFYVYCSRCYARGPDRRVKEHAIATWNRRALQYT